MKLSKNFLTSSRRSSQIKLVLIVSCFLAVSLSFAQKNLQPATIINANRDTLRGFIDYRNWEKNPDKIDFYQSAEGPAASYTAKNILHVINSRLTKPISSSKPAQRLVLDLTKPTTRSLWKLQVKGHPKEKHLES